MNLNSLRTNSFIPLLIYYKTIRWFNIVDEYLEEANLGIDGRTNDDGNEEKNEDEGDDKNEEKNEEKNPNPVLKRRIPKRIRKRTYKKMTFIK